MEMKLGEVTGKSGLGKWSIAYLLARPVWCPDCNRGL